MQVQHCSTMREEYTIYFTVSCCGIVSSTFVAMVLWRWGNFRISLTYLLFWLHVSLIAEEITLLPLVYSYSDGLCTTAQFFHFYFALMNIIVIFELVESHRYFLLGGFDWTHNVLQKYGTLLFLIFPIITVVPYAAQQSDWTSLADDDGGWCVDPINDSFSSAIAFRYAWAWLFLFGAICIMIYTAFRVLKADKIIASKYLSTVGLMVFISIIAWIPRSIEQIPSLRYHGEHINHRMVSFLPVPVSGICFGLLFYFFERPSLNLFGDRLFAPAMAAALGLQSTESPDNRGSFTWEIDELEFLQQLSSTSAPASGGTLSFIVGGRTRPPGLSNGSHINSDQLPVNARSSTSRRSGGASFVSALSTSSNPMRDSVLSDESMLNL